MFLCKNANKGITVALQWHYSAITVALQWYHSGIIAAVQWHYSGIIVALQWHYSGITVALQWHYKFHYFFSGALCNQGQCKKTCCSILSNHLGKKIGQIW